LPADQALPAACPACDLVLAKFGATPPPRPADESDEAGAITAFGERTWALITLLPERVDRTGLGLRVLLLAVFAIWGLRLIGLDYRVGEMGSSFLHGPLLVFHEAGHVLFLPFGEFLHIAGGTLGQLIMPAILCGALLYTNRDPYGAAFGLWLLGASLLDVAPYAYDALHPQLVLLGGHTGEEGGHDWIFLLGQLHLLPRAQTLGWIIHKLGAATLLLALYWAGWTLWRQRRRLVESEAA
jgi:hypothetical protein